LERLVINEDRLYGNWPQWDYRIEDATVERTFEINLSTFRRHGSPYTSMVQGLIALSYHASVLQRLHSGPLANQLAGETTHLIARANRFILECLENLCELSRCQRINKKDEALYEKLSEGCCQIQRKTWFLSQRMQRIQVAERVFNVFRVREAVQKQKWVSAVLGCGLATVKRRI